MQPVISITNLTKVYEGGFRALENINLDIKKGEIFALLGPNGAGKTTLIGTICGLVNITEGKVTVNGHDSVKSYRKARNEIGLVPQELTKDMFEKVWNTVRFSRRIFGKADDDALLEKILKQLSLWDKRDNQLISLSGGMKRRVMIAKALSHSPSILFLDEPTAGVDVELRKNMWELVHELRETGVTIVLTTHYIEEAEQMADRIGVINHGKLILVEEKRKLMRNLGRKQLVIKLTDEIDEIPASLERYNLELSEKRRLVYVYDPMQSELAISDLLDDINASGLHYKDLKTRQSSLEEIFVELVHNS